MDKTGHMGQIGYIGHIGHTGCIRHIKHIGLIGRMRHIGHNGRNCLLLRRDVQLTLISVSVSFTPLLSCIRFAANHVVYSENKKGVLQNLFVGSAVGYYTEPSKRFWLEMGSVKNQRNHL